MNVGADCPSPPPNSYHPIVGSHAAWLPGSGCSLANMPTSLWFSTAAPTNHEPRPCCLFVCSIFEVMNVMPEEIFAFCFPFYSQCEDFNKDTVFTSIYISIKMETTWNVMVRGAVAYDYLHVLHVFLS